MNDNQQQETHSLIEMIADNEQLTVLCSKGVSPEFVEMAAAMIRTHKTLHFVEMQHLDGGQILAYRGERPSGDRLAL